MLKKSLKFRPVSVWWKTFVRFFLAGEDPSLWPSEWVVLVSICTSVAERENGSSGNSTQRCGGARAWSGQRGTPSTASPPAFQKRWFMESWITVLYIQACWMGIKENVFLRYDRPYWFILVLNMVVLSLNWSRWIVLIVVLMSQHNHPSRNRTRTSSAFATSKVLLMTVHPRVELKRIFFLSSDLLCLFVTYLHWEHAIKDKPVVSWVEEILLCLNVLNRPVVLVEECKCTCAPSLKFLNRKFNSEWLVTDFKGL